MRRPADGLFERIAAFDRLIAAARMAVLGKRKKPGAAAFMANLEPECLRLERALRAGSWRPGGFVSFTVHDAKKRLVSAAPFRDRVVHHALCAEIGPLIERGFVADSFANRNGKGTHAAIGRYEHFRDRHRHVLRCDIWRYFPAIDHEVLKGDIRRRIACPPTLWLCDAIIEGSNPQEPVDLHFAGDDLLSPLERRRGLPIGNLTSQLFANLYLDRLDHFVKEVLRVRGYLRYVDDFALFHDDPDQLVDWRDRIAGFLEGRRLMLHPGKTCIASTAEPAEFLGYVLAPGNRRLPEANVRRFRNRLRSLRDRWRSHAVDPMEVRARIEAWIAHAAHADTWRLRHAIFRGGVFDPAREPGRLPAAPRPARRLLEQQSEEPPLRQPQQERAGEPEQQCRFPGGEYASMPEPGRSGTSGVSG